MAIRTYTINGQVDAVKLDSSIKKITTSNTYKIQIEADGSSTNRLSKSIQSVTDNTGQATKTIQKFNAKTGELDSTTQKVTSTMINSGKSLKDIASNFTDIIKKVTLFGGATAIIGLVTSAIGQAVKTVHEMDDAIVEFQKVSNLSGKSLNDYVKKLGEMGVKTGSTTKAMIEASTEFKKSGYSDEDSAKLASVTEMYRNVADEELTAGQAASFIISQMKAFNISAGESTHIIDAVNEVKILAFPIRDFRVIKDNCIG